MNWCNTFTGLLKLFWSCPNLIASAIRKPLCSPLNSEWPGAIAQRCGHDLAELDLTYQTTHVYESVDQMMTLVDLYNMAEGEELVKHRKAHRKPGE